MSRETFNKMASGRAKPLQSCNHIFVLLFLQTLIIIFFLLFVRYDPKTAHRNELSVTKGDSEIKDVYPLFQDVHVMIFIGFSCLMTFLKKYGLSAVSLNLMCSALAIEVFTLVFRFFTFIVKTQSSNLTLRIVQAVGHTLMSMWVHSYLLTLLLQLF